MKSNLTTIIVLFFLLYFSGPAVGAAGGGVVIGPEWVPDEIVVKFKSGLPEDHIGQINRQHGTTVLYTSPFAGFKRMRISASKAAREMVELYSSEPNVEYAELNYYAYAFFAPNDTYYNLQWHLKEASAGVNVEPAWDITTGAPNVIIAVLDTGVAYENYKGFEQAPDLVNTHFVSGYDFVNRDAHPNDEEGHGTHVAGTLAQSTNNSLGTAGIAFNCSIMPVKVLSRRGIGTYTDIADGFYFAADHGADVINVSLGGVSDSTTLRNAVAYAYNRRITIICAAGNDYESGNQPAYPAAYDEYCIATGATRFDRTRAHYSNTGSYLDLVAPGGDVSVDQNGDGYADGILQQTFGTNPKDWNYWFYEGTSMAAPHVSGIVALLVSVGITDPNHVREALQNTARDLGAPGWDQEYGWGLVDACATLNYYYYKGDFNYDGKIDYEDLVILVSYWLQNEPSVDIVPAGGDGIIDLLDYAKLAENWAPSGL